MFNPNLAIGQVISEKELHDIFECNMFMGIRKSKKNNLFVIMSGSAKKKIYDDVWDGDVLLYNGTDINSKDDSQTLDTGKGNFNASLKNVWSTPEHLRPQIFLFVKKEKNKCVYKGEVTLIKEPYMQKRHDDENRKVWIFPLKLKAIDVKNEELLFSSAVKASNKAELADLYSKVKGKEADYIYEKVARAHTSSTVVYDRNPDIAAYVKKRACGVCDLCGRDAPFKDEDGVPYLEAHHIKWLSKGGADEIDNVVALCPNCHRKMHKLNEKKDVDLLENKILEYKVAEKGFKVK